MSDAGVIGYEPRNSVQPGPFGRRDQAVRQRLVAADRAVAAGRQCRRLDLVVDGEALGGLAERPAGLQRDQVGPQDLPLAAELGLQEAAGALQRPVVQPGQQPEREHVLRPLGVLATQPDLADRLDRQRRQLDGVHLVVAQAAVLERADGVPDLGQVPLGELVGVDDDGAAARQVRQVGLERGRVHRDQHGRRVARGDDAVVGEVQLEGGDTGQGAGGGPDLGREVGQGRQAVAERRRLGGEPVAGQLHAVTGVAGEPDDHLDRVSTGLPAVVLVIGDLLGAGC